MGLPKRKFETGTDDVQTIDCDIDSLRAKFLTPIDNIRSYSKPGPVFSGKANEAFDGMETSSSRPLESRAHAFLRFIGFPVATEDGFYNPGFQPQGQVLNAVEGAAVKNENIRRAFSDAPFAGIVSAREQDSIRKAAIFERRDLSAALYTLLLTSSSALRPFQNFKEGAGPFDVDNQSFTVKFRQTIADNFFSKNPNLSVTDASALIALTKEAGSEESDPGSQFTDGRHILKPFVVDPRIDITAMPDTSRVAVPFLPDEDSLRIDQNKSVLRPGIELIIRERLRKSSSEASGYYDAITKLANDEIGPSDLVITQSSSINTRDLRSSAEAVLDNNEITSSNIVELQGISTVQVKYITDLVKTIKCLIAVLRDSLEAISEVETIINWIPIPHPSGPELGGQGNRASLAIEGTSNVLTAIDRRINSLKIQKFAAQRKITEEVSLGNFASPFQETPNTSNIAMFDQELSGLIAQRNRVADIGYRAMGRIETIMGEVSGLGLIDVLSVYIALWSMKEDALISLLDDASFNRLVLHFGDLIDGGPAEERLFGPAPKTITEALQDFEDKLRNVFNFVDREFARQGLAPDEEEGGLISPDS